MTGRGGRRAAAIWIILAALLAVAVFLELDDRSAESGADVPTGPPMLLPAPIEEIGAIEIAVEGILHRFARDDEGAWFYHGVHAGPQGAHEHVPDPAMSEKIGKSLNGLGRARIERRVEMGAEDRFGVSRPEMIILIYLSNQIEPRMQYAVGDIGTDELSRYVHIVGTPEVVMIPDYQIRNLRDLIAAVSTTESQQSRSAS